jgi:hypothetical protein
MYFLLIIKGITVVSSGELVGKNETITQNGSKETYYYKLQIPSGAYSILFSVGHYDSIDIPLNDSVTLRSYCLSTKKSAMENCLKFVKGVPILSSSPSSPLPSLSFFSYLHLLLMTIDNELHGVIYESRFSI